MAFLRAMEPSQALRLFTIPFEPARDLVRGLLARFLHIEVNGLEFIPPAGGALLVANHTDLIDVPIQGAFSPRKVTFLGKAELFEPGLPVKEFLLQKSSPLHLPFLLPLRQLAEQVIDFYSLIQKTQLEEWGGHPIMRSYRGEGARDAVRYYQELEDHVVELLKKGELISIFPEGTRTRTGIMGSFKSLAARMAIRASVPIIPSGFKGSFQFLSLTNVLTGKVFDTRVEYNIGRPYFPEEFPQGDLKKAAHELTALVEKQVYALSLHAERRSAHRSRARVL